MKIIACNSSKSLAQKISKHINVPLADASIRTFNDREIFVEINENIRGEDVFIIQSTSHPANDHLMELLITIDAARRGSAKRITAVIPYYGYARQDRKTGPRTPITAKLVANLITSAGVLSFITAPDFESQSSFEYDNSTMDFTATVTATDASGNAATQVITDKVRDVGGIDDNPNTGTGTGTGTATVATSTGTATGTIDTGDVIVGIKVFRNSLVIFCKNSIFELTNLDSTPILKSVTKNIGCVDGNTIQEIGGDLIFLAPDGLRTISGTARIGDVELSSISRKILPVINNLLDNIASFTISSMVIRERSQYRLFYFQSGQAASSQKGIIGTFKFDANGVPAFEWSETLGMEIKRCTSDLDVNNKEVQFGSNETGYVYQLDTGNNFDGSNISAQFQTPDMDYGDNGLRKSLYAVKANIEPEGTNNNLKLLIRYDFESTEVPQPGSFNVGNLSSAAVFGASTSIFGQSIFGAVVLPSKRMIVTGSGFSNNFKFFTDDTDASYSVKGLFVSFIAGGRR